MDWTAGVVGLKVRESRVHRGPIFRPPVPSNTAEVSYAYLKRPRVPALEWDWRRSPRLNPIYKLRDLR